MQINLDNREYDFLIRIVSEFIELGEPISSRHLSKLDGVVLSAASIRSVMLNLTEKGLLYQPHCSAGRVPTDFGYRIYVDQMSEKEFSDDSPLPKRTQTAFAFEELLKECLNYLSNDTKLASLATSPNPDCLKLRSIKFYQFDEMRLLAVIVTDDCFVIKKIFKVREHYPAEFLSSLGTNLTRLFKHKLLVKIRNSIVQTLADKDFPMDNSMFKEAVSILNNALNIQEQYQVLYSGIMNINSWKGIDSVEAINSFFQEIEEGNKLKQLLNDDYKNNTVYFKIGNELKLKHFDNYSLVAANYGTANLKLGCIGVLGPKRMDYQKIANLVKKQACIISKSFSSKQTK